MNSLKDLFEKLEKEVSNLKKSINRPCKKETCEEKIKIINELSENISEILRNTKTKYLESAEVVIFNDIALKYKEYRDKALEILKNYLEQLGDEKEAGDEKLEESKEEKSILDRSLSPITPKPIPTKPGNSGINNPGSSSNNFSLTKLSTGSIMANFSFETGLKLPSLSNDNDKMLLRDFLDTIESYHDTLDAAGKIALLKFVKLNRIQGKAKTRLGDLDAIDTLAKLKTTLMTQCGSAETIESLYGKLGSTQQGRRSLTQFVEDLDLICEKIVALEVTKQNITDDAVKTAIKSTVKSQALQVFKRGIHDEYKVVVEAARPTSLADALSIATSSTLGNMRGNAEINYFRGSRNGNRGYNNGNRSFQSNRGNGYRGNRYNNNNNYNNNNSYRGKNFNNQHRGGNRNQGNSGNRQSNNFRDNANKNNNNSNRNNDNGNSNRGARFGGRQIYLLDASGTFVEAKEEDFPKLGN